MDKVLILNKLKEHYNFKSNSDFARFLGVNPQNIRNWYKRNNYNANLLIEKCTEINPEFIITGEGAMIKENNQNEDLPVKNYSTGVPYYNVDFIGGFDIVLNDQTITPEYLIDFKEFNKATCWCNITGHSMEPEINHGDIVALKEIEDFSFIPYGEIYAIITKNDMRTIKRIGPSTNPDNYILIPTNKGYEYGPQELPKKYILRIYQVLGSVKRF